MDSMQHEQEWLDTRQLGRMLNVSTKFLEKHRRRLPGGAKVGGSWRYRRAEVEKRLLSGQLLLPAERG